jgi:hypothetical protein
MMKTLMKKCYKKKRKFKKCVNNQARLGANILQQWELPVVVEQTEMIAVWILGHLVAIAMIISLIK